MPTLEWIGKEKVINHHQDVPFKVLENKYGYSSNGVLENEIISGNKIIRGDNLEVMKALLPQYEGKIKCIYIDPPYNTGNEKWVYNDNVNHPKIKKWLGEVVGKEGEDLSRHDKWLCMMYPRLKLLQKLLSEDGTIFISIDDNEVSNMKLICDEIFGSNNFINQITVKTKPTAGASGGGEDKKFKKNVEYILCYVKNYQNFKRFNDVYEEVDLFELIEQMKSEGKSWKYTRVLCSFGEKNFFKDIKDSKGNNIKIYKHSNVVIKTISELAKELMNEKGITLAEAVKEVHFTYFDRIWRDTNAQSSIRQRVIEATDTEDTFYSIEYYPQSGKNKGELTTLYYKGKNKDILAWLKDVAYKNKKSIVKQEKLGTYWGNFNWNNVTKEGDIKYSNGKKPIALIKQIIELSTTRTKNDIILDCFAGSGSTAHAVLQKNYEDGGNRNVILIEMEEHADSITAERVKRVISGYGKVKGITGDFNFYDLGQRLLLENNYINEAIDIKKIREYIFYMETKQAIKEDQSLDNEYYLGSYNESSYYLLYEKDKSTTLDHEFLSKIKSPSERYIIYADKNLLSKDELEKFKIIFKKIPRDIIAI